MARLLTVHFVGIVRLVPARATAVAYPSRSPATWTPMTAQTPPASVLAPLWNLRLLMRRLGLDSSLPASHVRKQVGRACSPRTLLFQRAALLLDRHDPHA